MKLDRTPRRRDHGFTLPEIIVSSGIILTVVTAFVLFMTALTSTQRSSNLARIADRALGAQIEQTNALTWDNLMMAPTGTYSDCDLGNGRVSTQAVQPGPQIITNDGLKMSVSRAVTWTSTNTPVTCTSTAKLRADTKTVTVTVTWNDGNAQRTTTSSVQRSANMELPLGTVSGTYVTPALIASPPTSNSSGWSCTGGGTFVSNGTTLIAQFPNTTNSPICGYTISGLTQGKFYTATLQVQVPAKSTAMDANAGQLGRGGVAPADGSWQNVTVTWQQQNGTSTLVGVSPVDSSSHLAGAYVTVRSLSVYSNQ